MKSNFKSSKPTEEKYEKRTSVGKKVAGFTNTPKSSEIIKIVKTMIEDDYESAIVEHGKERILEILMKMLSTQYFKIFEPTTTQVKNVVKKCVISFIAKMASRDGENESKIAEILEIEKIQDKTDEQIEEELKRLKTIKKRMALKTKNGIDELIETYQHEIKKRNPELMEDIDETTAKKTIKKSKKSKKTTKSSKQKCKVSEEQLDISSDIQNTPVEQLEDKIIIPEEQEEVIDEILIDNEEPAIVITKNETVIFRNESNEHIFREKINPRVLARHEQILKKKVDSYKKYTLEDKTEEVEYYEMVRNFTNCFEFLAEDEISYYSKIGGRNPGKFDSFERYSRFEYLRYRVNRRMTANRISELDAIAMELNDKCSVLGPADKKILTDRRDVINREMARDTREDR